MKSSPCKNCTIHKAKIDKWNPVCTNCTARFEYAMTGHTEKHPPIVDDVSAIPITRPPNHWGEIVNAKPRECAISWCHRKANSRSIYCHKCDKRIKRRKAMGMPVDEKIYDRNMNVRVVA